MVINLLMILGGLIVSPLPEVLTGLALSLEFLRDSLLLLIEALLFCRLVLGGDFLFILMRYYLAIDSVDSFLDGEIYLCQVFDCYVKNYNAARWFNYRTLKFIFHN